MQAILLIELVCVLLGVAAGSPWYRNRDYGQLSSFRSRQSPWYRSNRDISLERACNNWNHRFEQEFSISAFGGRTEHGYLCHKSLGLVRILSWCDFEEVNQGTVEILRVYPTLVDSRPSSLSTCLIRDITLRGTVLHSGEWCFFMLVDGVLSCVEEEELQPHYQLLTVYPVEIPIRDGVTYIICSTSMGTYCPGPTKVITTVEIDEEFRGFDCHDSPTGSLCTG